MLIQIVITKNLNLNIDFEMISMLINLILKYQSLIENDFHKYLKEFHLLCFNKKAFYYLLI